MRPLVAGRMGARRRGVRGLGGGRRAPGRLGLRRLGAGRLGLRRLRLRPMSRGPGARPMANRHRDERDGRTGHEQAQGSRRASKASLLGQRLSQDPPTTGPMTCPDGPCRLTDEALDALLA